MIPRETPIPPDVLRPVVAALARAITVRREAAIVAAAVERALLAIAKLNMLPTRAAVRELALAALSPLVDEAIDRMLSAEMAGKEAA